MSRHNKLLQKQKKTVLSRCPAVCLLTSSKLILLVTKNFNMQSILSCSCFDHLQTCGAFIYIPPSRHLHGSSSAVQAALWLLYCCTSVAPFGCAVRSRWIGPFRGRRRRLRQSSRAADTQPTFPEETDIQAPTFSAELG